MVQAKPILLIVAADRREFDGFRASEWGLRPGGLDVRWSAAGARGDTAVLLAANGPGMANAAAALEACHHLPVGAVVSSGFVGALAPELRVGDIFLATSVLEFSTQLEYSVKLPECASAPAGSGRLLTFDRVAQDAATKAELRKLGAAAVDMEAAAVARGALARQVPFYCVRAVSDDARTSFEIDFNRARRPDGTFSGWRIAAQAGLSRRRWQHLMDLKRACEKASRSLAAFLRHCSFEF